MPVRNKRRKERTKERRPGPANQRSKSLNSAFLTSKITAVTLLSISVILLAYVYHKHQEHMTKLTLDETLSRLIEAEEKASVNPNTKVAVGFGSCQDIIVQSRQVLQESPPKKPEHFYAISTREELLKVFAYFYQHGAASERFITNSSLFGELVSVAQKAPSARYEIGGNAAVMAGRFAKEGCKVLLGAQMSQSMIEQFSKDIQISGPITKEDDVHLLLEYPAGQTWGRLSPPRANRFIVHNDHQNPLLSSVEKFSVQIKQFIPHLLVVGGLQMMDNFPMQLEKRKERLLKVQELMKIVPRETKIHFEMASYSDEILLKELVQYIIPYANSLGMNEQELPNLFDILKYGNVSLISEPNPRIAAVLDQMRDMFKVLQDTEETHGRRKLTRLHVHTLAFHAIMVEKTSPWKNTLSAISKSVLVANRHTCGSDVIDTAKAKLIMDDSFTTSLNSNAKRIPFDPKRPVACWDEGSTEICVAPVLVCTDVLQTGGGGDNISSAGLVLQV